MMAFQIGNIISGKVKWSLEKKKKRKGEKWFTCSIYTEIWTLCRHIHLYTNIKNWFIFKDVHLEKYLASSTSNSNACFKWTAHLSLETWTVKTSKKNGIHWFFCDMVYCKGKFYGAQWFCVLGIMFPRNTHAQTEVPPTASERSQIKEMLAMVLQTNEKPARQLFT